MTKNNYRADFPLIQNSNIAYLDSGATSQKPTCVIEALRDYYAKHNANPNRGAYELSVEATKIYHDAREKVAKFLHAKSPNEIIFTKNATEASNLIAYSYGENFVKDKDEIVLSIMEHHSSIVPWQHVAKVTGAKLKYMYLDAGYNLTRQEILSKITPKTKVVVVSSVSNVLGTVSDLSLIVSHAHKMGAVVVADISQSIAHSPFDVSNIDVDFAFFSAHKMFGPMGIGVLYGKENILNSMPPFIMGGDMIEYVEEQHTTFALAPKKFEAGTQNVEGAYGLDKAIDYLLSVGYKRIEAIETKLMAYAIKKLSVLPYITLYLPKNKHSSVIAFNIANIHSHDVASLLNSEGVCVRSGNHCAQPLHKYLGIDSTVRVSISIYNTKDDIDKLIFALEGIYKRFEKYITGGADGK